MTSRRRIENLEKRYHKPGTCPTCGMGESHVDFIEVLSQGEGEPLGFYYEKPWPDHRPGERFPYPPDPRPICPACSGHVGDALICTAIYDPAEWQALQKQALTKG